MTIATALQQGTRLLEDAHISAPRLTAEVLLAHALSTNSAKRDRVWLYAHSNEELPEVAWIHYGRYLHQRLEGKPTQYITKRQEFYGRDFYVTPAVLIPRPETEHVVETALRRAPQARLIADFGAGSGAIGITVGLELKAPVVLTDISFEALEIARENSRRLGAEAQCAVMDFGSALGEGVQGKLNLILSNPPYIPFREKAGLSREVREYEPHVALFGGEEGTEAYERVIADALRLLSCGGLVVMELGYQSLGSVRAKLNGSQWTDVQITEDLAGWPRVISACKRA